MVMVGDYRFDLDCGRAAGTRTVLVNLPDNPGRSWPIGMRRIAGR
jgi:phosphoglycolate phosphatase-like HAD superfamily hydrolase